MGLNIRFTLIILLLAIVAFLAITAWDEVIYRILFQYLELDRESIWGWVMVSIISTLLLFLVLLIFRIEAHDILGISETVDTVLTGEKESVSTGNIVHTKI